MFAKTIVLLAAATATLAMPERIIGGMPAAPGEIPFQLSIQDRDGNHYCGGVIVGPDTAITSAACISKVQIGHEGVVAGAVMVNNPGSVHQAQTITIHPDFATINGIYHNDLALLRVRPSFPSNEVTGRAFMPIQGYVTPEGLNATTSGWGTTSFGGPSSSTLLHTVVPTMDRLDCEEAYSDLFTLPPNVICAGLPEGGADACDRDQGGPLFERGVVYGIFSWGGRCGEPGRPGVYTDVAAFRNWIDSNSV